MAPPAPPHWDCHVHVFDADSPVVAGHYRPASSPLPQIEVTARAHGVGHLVLVQPSVYGSDNRVMLDALRAGDGRHRGIAVVDAPPSPAALDEWHAVGVRGIRFNLVSPVGTATAAVATLLRQMTPALAARGWHVQFYAAPDALPTLRQWQQDCGLPFVLDHLAAITPAHMDDAAAWTALRQLAGRGAWIKLSGWYRLQARAPYLDLRGVVQRAHALFGDRCVWGSDWPHTSFAAGEAPLYASVMAPLTALLPTAADAAAVLGAGARLYR